MENMFVKRKISCDAMLQGAPSTLVLDHQDVAFKQSACYYTNYNLSSQKERKKNHERKKGKERKK